MKRLRCISILLALIISASSYLPAYAGEKKAQKELPFYFPEGVVQALSPLQQMQEYLRLLAATNDRFQGREHSGVLIPGSDSISVETDLETTSTDGPPLKMKLVLDHYVRLPDGRIRVTLLDGQLIITEHQLKAVVDDLLEMVNLAADYNFAYYKPLVDKAISVRAAKLGVSEEELRSRLDEKVRGTNVTIRELNSLPRITKRSDFVPRELHLGYNTELPGIFGVAWLNTGIVYYNPQARIRDFLSGRPLVIQHEMIHNNSNLQEFPMSEGADMELIASIPEMLYPENRIDFFYHGYSRDLRELMWIYFGLNPKQVRKEVIRYDHAGNLVIDEQKYNEYFQKLELIKSELMVFLQDVAVPEFYSDPVFWSAMNEKLADKNSVFRVMMAANYEPTILGGLAETRKWREPRRDEFEDMARESYEISGKKNGVGAQPQPPEFLVSQYNNLFSELERERLQNYFETHPDVLEKMPKMSAADLIQFLRNFKTGSIGGVR
ncbi:MAG: hypothetical protein HZB99_04780 [Candidatus Harrisonbacteria bacterium]|nr:hypothetical protein [Candidatus Harrisonbacteria bacterium]